MWPIAIRESTQWAPAQSVLASKVPLIKSKFHPIIIFPSSPRPVEKYFPNCALTSPRMNDSDAVGPMGTSHETHTLVMAIMMKSRS